MLTDAPVLSVTLNTATNQSVFKCSFLPLDQGNVAYTLEWVVDGESQRVDSVTDGKMSRLFNESQYTEWKYGTKVSPFSPGVC